MAIKLTGESFLQCVKQSNLIEAEQLNRLLQEFRQHGVRLDDSRALAEEFIARGALTSWQAEKLLQGKHKGFTLGKYRLQSLLGKGGMSSVYLAEHVLMRRRCAIKVLPSKRVNDSSYLGRFHREAQAVAALDHPNIVRAYDVDKEVEKDTEIHFLVMEYVEGQSLHDLVTQSGVMSYTDAAEYIRQAACGLQHAHNAGMVHRDIKPGNLLVDQNGVVKILDLGLARFFNEGDEQSLTVAHDEKVLGTADYLAPEQALDSHRVDARADIYSLGCTFYFMLTGHPPFTEGTLAQRLMAHQTKQPPAIEQERADIPPDLNDIILRMMAKKLPERFQSADDVGHALADWLDANAGEAWRRTHGRGRASAPREAIAAPGARPQETVTDGARNDTQPAAKRTARRSEPQMPVWTPPGEAPPVAAPPTPRPVAKSPAPRTPPPTPAQPVAQDDDNFHAFLSNLDVAPPAAKSPSSKSSPRAASPPSSGNIPVAAPASDRNLPVAEAVPVGGSGPSLASAVPMAAPVSGGYSVAVDSPPVAVAEAIPVAEAVEDVVERPSAPSRTRRSKPTTLPKLNADLLKDRRVQVGAGAAVLLFVVVPIVWSIVGGGESPKPPENGGGVVTPDTTTPDGPKGTDPKNLMGKPVVVGRDFESISAALKYVGENWQPISRKDTQIIQVPGGKTYPDRIVADNVSRDAFGHGIRIVSDGPVPAILAPPGNDPVISLKNHLDKLTVEGFEINADGKPVAIEISGNLNGLRLKDLTVRGFTQAGVLGKAPVGLGSYDEEVAVEACRFQGAASAVGVKLVDAGGDLVPSRVFVRQCRFIGPMAAAVAVASDARFLHFQQNIVAETEAGLRFDGANRQFQSVLVLNNSFYKVKRPIVFVELPNELSSRNGFFRNLFAEPAGPEAIVEKGYDKQKFVDILEGGIAGMEENWSSRPAAPMPAADEVDYFFSRNGQRGVNFQFASTNPGDPKFLAPGPSSPQKNPLPTDARRPLPFIGAVGP